MSEALLQHWLMLNRCSRCCEYVSMEITAFFCVALLLSSFEIYDFLLMPWAR